MTTGIGNPLLDILAPCDIEFVRKYDLQPGQTITNSSKYDDLINQLANNYKVKFIAGGSAQNTIRVCQWLLCSEPKICSYIGCIGKDFFGQCMRSRVEDEGVNVAYIEINDKGTKTGYCCVLAFKNDAGVQQSTMITWLGAAHCFLLKHLDQNWAQVERARIIILEGYFLEVCPQAVAKIAQHLLPHKERYFCINIAAPYVVASFWNELYKLMDKTDFVFAVPQEIEMMAKKIDPSSRWTLEEQISKIANDPPMKNVLKKRNVIVDCDTRILTAIQGVSGCKSYPVTLPNSDESKDNSGCRDAFVAGYISGLFLDKPEADRVVTAVYASQEILKQDGCTIPKHPPNYEPSNLSSDILESKF